jgi:hypothetical protein
MGGGSSCTEILIRNKNPHSMGSTSGGTFGRSETGEFSNTPPSK